MTDTPAPRPLLSLMPTLALATVTASLGVGIATVLLPALTRDFGASVSQVQWVMLGYLLSLTTSIVTAGRLGDLVGRRRVLIAGLAVFAGGSILCAMAPDMALLIAGRALQGLGGAALMAMPMALARDLVADSRLGTALGVLGTSSAVGTALGPSLGGLLLAWADWRAAFWGLAGIGVLAAVPALCCIPRDVGRTRLTPRALDLPGNGLLAISLAGYAMAASGQAATAALTPLGLAAVTLTALVLFVRVEARAPAPLVPLALLRDGRTGLGVAMNVAVGTVMMATLVVGPFFLAFSLRLPDAGLGLVLAVGPMVSGLTGIPAGWLTDRFGARRVMLAGLAQTVVGLLCLAIVPRHFGVTGYILALIVLTPAFQLFLAANNTAVLSDTPRDIRGRVSGLLGLSRNLGLMTGASVMAALFGAILGTGDPSGAAPDRVAQAFSLTFMAAACLALFTLGLALLARTTHRHAVPGPGDAPGKSHTTCT